MVAMKKTLSGKWTCLPFATWEGYDIEFSRSMAYSCLFTDHVAVIDYVAFQHRFLYRVSSFGGVLKVTSYPFEKGLFKSFEEERSELLPHYFILVTGKVGISIRPIESWKEGVIALCLRR
jgi:hypothetical protein